MNTSIVHAGLLASVLALASGCAAARLTYPIVDTGQDRCFTNSQEIAYPAPGADFDGQDAQYRGLQPAYRDNGDGTVSDLNTGLMWVKTPDLKKTSTYPQALAGAKDCRVGGHDDWRLPTIKELYSLIDFRGYSFQTAEKSRPYLDAQTFDFVFGDVSRGQRLIDAQYASSNLYVGAADGNTPGGKLFGVNFADGRIKGYDLVMPGGFREKTFYVRYVRGNSRYGINDFADNGDGTVTDRATGLTWAREDSGKAMNWEEALRYAEVLTLAGHDDWRLPNAKELQSLIDYSRAPDAKDPARRGPAIDPVFKMTDPEAWYWTGTTHLDNHACGFAVYVCFGMAMGQKQGVKVNVHGAGAQRSDPKSGDPQVWASGNGPQGDQVRIYNYVRCVRGGNVVRLATGPAVDGTYAAGHTRPPPAGGMGPANRGRRGQGPMAPGGPGLGPDGFVNRLDLDNDGKVSPQEFDGPPDGFNRFDRNHDGFITPDEVPPVPPPGR